MGGSRHLRPGRIRRPAALQCALATLLAALFLCLSAGEVHSGGTAPGKPHLSVGHAAYTAAYTAGYTAEYTCPYDRSGCGPFSHTTPAVLTAPPPAAPVAAAELPHGELPRAVGDVRAAGALPRAPDLHVLQVLRT